MILERLSHWWQGRRAREQRLLALAGLAVLAILLIQLLVLPIRDWRDAAAARAERSQELYDTVLPLARRLSAVGIQDREAAPAAEPVPVRLTATRLAQAMAIDIVRLQGSAERVELWLGTAEPAALFDWLARLEGQRILASEVTLDAAGVQGVTGRLVLERTP